MVLYYSSWLIWTFVLVKSILSFLYFLFGLFHYTKNIFVRNNKNKNSNITLNYKLETLYSISKSIKIKEILTTKIFCYWYFMPYLLLKNPFIYSLIKYPCSLTNEKGETSIIQCYFLDTWQRKMFHATKKAAGGRVDEIWHEIKFLYPIKIYKTDLKRHSYCS